MHCDSKQFVPIQPALRAGGFTLVEIAAALAILAGLLASALIVMNNAVQATLEIQGRRQAFEIARENLESLLTVTAISDQADSGRSERYPDIRWELTVEPFYEPISNKMWIRAVSAAYYCDKANQEQAVRLEHWLTGLSAQQIKQILQQQALEEKILEELYGPQEDPTEEMTKVCLEQAGLDAAAYENFIQQQRREKINYLIQNGLGKEYDQWLQTLEEAKSAFLQSLGVDFDRLNECIAYLYANPQLLPSSGSGTDERGEIPSENPTETKPDDSQPTTDTQEQPSSQEPDCPFDCSKIDPSLKPIICQLTGCCCD